MAVDRSGNIYVTGHSYGVDTLQDYATVKYAPDGTELWTARYNGPADSQEEANAIALDSSGNVYVTGYSYGVDTLQDYATVKYAPDGTELWVARYNELGNSYDVARAIGVDTWGNVYVTGGSGDDIGGPEADYATVKYAPDGTELWMARYNGPGNIWDNAYAIAVDGSGNVYVTGQTDGTYIDADYGTVKYDTNGNQLWVAIYDSGNNGGARAMTLDSSGNVYVTGNCGPIGTTVKYSQFQDPLNAIGILIETVLSLNLQQGISNSLNAKLEAALQALDDVNANNNVAAITTLEAFINAVEAQRGGWISDTDAEELIAQTIAIIAILETG
jgi:hypothetical protein